MTFQEDTVKFVRAIEEANENGRKAERARLEKPVAFALWAQAVHEEVWREFEDKVWKK